MIWRIPSQSMSFSNGVVASFFVYKKEVSVLDKEKPNYQTRTIRTVDGEKVITRKKNNSGKNNRFSNRKHSEKNCKNYMGKKDGDGKKGNKQGISIKRIKRTVTRPVSSSVKHLKSSANKYAGGSEDGGSGDGLFGGGSDGSGSDWSSGNYGLSPFQKRMRDNELLELLKALIKIIKAVIVATMIPVLVAIAVVYLIISMVISILFGSSDSEADSGGDDVRPIVIIDDDSTLGDALYSELQWPCPSVPAGDITDDFGPREAPTAGASTYHRGIDIGAAYGSDIVAAEFGEVVTKGADSIRGLYVVIDHGNGMQTWYLHQSMSFVQEGDLIERGEVIGRVGESGIATGPHLHFEVHIDGEAVDPMGYFE